MAVVSLARSLHDDLNLRNAKIAMFISNFIEKDEFEKNHFIESIQNDKPYIINIEKMMALDAMLTEYFLQYPGDFLSELRAALRVSYLCKDDIGIEATTEINIGVKNLPSDRRISVGECSLAANTDRLIEVKGIITHISLMKPTLVDAVFKCQTCNENINHHFDLYDMMRRKFFCPVCDRVASFEIDKQNTILVNTQMVTVTEPYSFAVSPPKVDLWLVGNLIDSPITEKKKIIAGNQINVVGILHHVQTKESGTTFVAYLEVLSWETETQMVTITKQDENKIIELSKDPEIFGKLVISIAPSIYGCEAEKEAILVMLTGGNQVIKPDGTHRRGTIHIMFVGDPATAKTRLAEWIIRNFPKSQYAVGSEATAAGLSASLRHDKASGYWFIDPGALVMAHESVAVIDEMDKMKKEDMGPLDQVMEMEMLVINKAGINARFPDSVGILGILNPLKGRYDDLQSIDEQVNIADSTLTRFDLKFLFRDKPEDKRDKGMLEVMTHPEKYVSVIPTDILIRYILYTKRYRPILTPDAEEELKTFFLQLRKQYSTSKVMSISPRQYDALLRLSEAYAKLRLSDQVILEDAQKAIKLLRQYILSFGMEEGFGINIDQAEGRPSRKTTNEIDRIIEIFKELENIHGQKVPRLEWVAKCVGEGMVEETVKRRVEALIREGRFMEPKVGFISKT